MTEQDKELNKRAILQNFANWWAEYTTDKHYTGNSYCLEAMQAKTDECLDQIIALARPIIEKQESERMSEWLSGWCEHTANPLQRRYLCKACRQALKDEKK